MGFCEILQESVAAAVRQALRMPLYGDDRQKGMPDPFDDIVAGTADWNQIFAQMVQGLVVGGVD